MDHNKGDQIPAGLLPEVNVHTGAFQTGLALMLMGNRVTKHDINPHLQVLQENLPRWVYPSFQLIDMTTGPAEFCEERLRPLKAEARKSYRVFFIATPHFAPRYQLLLSLVEHAFIYVHTPAGLAVMALKINGEVLTHDAHVVRREHLLLNTKAAEKPLRVSVDVPKGMTPAETQESFTKWLAEENKRRLELGRAIGNV